MGNIQNKQAATFESVWAGFQELREIQKETDRKIKEVAELQKENELAGKETDRQMKETDRRMKELQKTVGGWANNHGSFAEEYFFNSFENGKQNFFGEKFDIINNSFPALSEFVNLF